MKAHSAYNSRDRCLHKPKSKYNNENRSFTNVAQAISLCREIYCLNFYCTKRGNRRKGHPNKNSTDAITKTELTNWFIIKDDIRLLLSFEKVMMILSKIKFFLRCVSERKLIAKIFFTVFLFITAYSCNTTAPDENNRLALTIVDVSSTEAWLKLRANPLKVKVSKDGVVLFELYSPVNDTVLYIENLLPNKKYILEASSNAEPHMVKSKVEVQTLALANNNFLWESFIFGDYGTCEINDIEIIDENNIYAVGRISYVDSLDPDNIIHFYNAVHWNGEKWDLLKIPSPLSFNNNKLTVSALQSVYAVSSNNIWFTSGGQMIHWDGINFGDWSFLYESFDDSSFGPILQLGGHGDIICGGGKKANIIINSGISWKEIETNAQGDIMDVWGAKSSSNDNVAYAILTDHFGLNNKIIVINDNKTITFNQGMTGRLFSSLWTKSGFPIYLAGDGIFNNPNSKWEDINTDLDQYVVCIRGNELNDIMGVGENGIVTHFNGIRWELFPDLAINGYYSCLSFKNDVAAIGGIHNGKAVIVIGRRN